MGVAALVLGLIALLAGVVPRVFAIAYAVSILTLPVGFFALHRVRCGVASNRGMALAATLFGIAGLTLSATGYVLTR